jgi:Na+-translocating ferredoxin:NAD+ oxidoreductase subunit G
MASKRESNFINMVSTLVLVTGIAALALGGIYNITKGPIEAAKLRKQQEAIKAVLPPFHSLETRLYKSAREADSLQFNLAYDEGGQLVGVAVNTFTNRGFSGNIKVMVGFLPDGTISNTSVLEHKETPGLGDKMQQNKSAWSLQFNGIHPASVDLRMTKDGGQIDAITAATITARAFSDAIQRAYETFEQNKGDM